MAYQKPKSYREFLEIYGNGRNTDSTYKEARREAQATYDSQRSTYGAGAESLASAGLTGSGYAAYLDTKAKRSLESTSAKLALAQDNANRTQYASYQKYLDGIEKQKLSAKTQLYRSLVSIRMTNLDSALRLAGVYGLSKEEARESAQSAVEASIQTLKQEIMDKIRTERTSGERAAYYGETYGLPEEVIQELRAFAERLYGKSTEGLSYENYEQASKKG